MRIYILGGISLLLMGCTTEEKNTLYMPPKTEAITHKNDMHLKEQMFDVYGTAVRWRWNDGFIGPNQIATPIKSDLVIPVTDIIRYLWIGAYESVGPQGVAFIKELFPPELQYIGSYIYENDGTRILGFAEGGARISLLNLNAYDLKDRDWLTNPGGGILATVHHEFSHIVHQNYGLPSGFNTISEGYLGAGWINGISKDDAVKRGMVRDYGTANPFEDFCEIISHFLTLKKTVFEEGFITQQDCAKLRSNAITNCEELNAGRLLIKQKLDLIIEFYKENFNIDLVEVRDNLELRIDDVVTNNKIP